MPPKRKFIKVEDDDAPILTGYRAAAAVKHEQPPPLESDAASHRAPLPPLPDAIPAAVEVKKPEPSNCPFRAICMNLATIGKRFPPAIKRIYAGDHILLLPALVEGEALDESAFIKPPYVGDVPKSDASNHPRKPHSMNMTREYGHQGWGLDAAFREPFNNARDDGKRIMSTQYQDRMAVPAVFIEPVHCPSKINVIVKHKQKKVTADKQWRGFILIEDKDKEGKKAFKRVLLWRVAKVTCTDKDCMNRRNSDLPDVHYYITNYGSRMDGEQHFRFDKSSKQKTSGDYAGCENWKWAVAGCHGDGLKVSICTFVRLGVEFSLYSNGCRWEFAEHDFKHGEGRGIGKTCMTDVETADTTQVELRTTDLDFDPFRERNWYFRDARECIFVEGVGELLLHPDHRGKVFVKNTHVETFQKQELFFGYQMAYAKLSRDRDQSGLNHDYIQRLFEKGYESVEQRPRLMKAIWDMLTSADATWESKLNMSGPMADALAQYWVDSVKTPRMSAHDIEGIYPVRDKNASHDRDRVANMYNARTFRECPPKVFAWITGRGSRFHPDAILKKWEEGFLALRTSGFTGWDLAKVTARCAVLEDMIKKMFVTEMRCAVKFHLGDLDQVNRVNAGVAWSYDVLVGSGVVHMGPFYLDSIHWNAGEGESKLTSAAYISLLTLLTMKIGHAFGVEHLAFNQLSADSRRDRFRRNAVRVSEASEGVKNEAALVVNETADSNSSRNTSETTVKISVTMSASGDRKMTARDQCQMDCINRCVNCPVCARSWAT